MVKVSLVISLIASDHMIHVAMREEHVPMENYREVINTQVVLEHVHIKAILS